MSNKGTNITLRLILGDQLNQKHSWFAKVDKQVVYLLAEMRQETDYVAHHIQKVVAFFTAMRAFAGDLEAAGHRVIYLSLDDDDNPQKLDDVIEWAIGETGAKRFEYQLPDEWRVDQQLIEICERLDIQTEAADSEHFLTSREFLGEFFEGKKSWLMETFYRAMRRDFDLLMDGNDPAGGKWNFDENNRKKLPKGHEPVAPKLFSRDVTAVVERIEAAGVKTIGNIDPDEFIWPVTRSESEELLEFFVAECLPLFGTYQDAMTPQYWSLYHSRLSFAMNAKLLSPLEVVQRAIQAWEDDPKLISLSQIEGFVRQIIGWREYMRGVYWAKMPDYASGNYFGHDRELPGFFWSAETDMACMRHAIGQSLDYAYAHHIQRLMVTGNFALLAGIDPDAVDAWYLGIYIDALEWVEITNTRGMSQFADGGIVGTKPYVASANYMHKMSHYCADCKYDHRDKVGDNSCPFNSLYWDFHERHVDKLGNNHRLGMTYRTLSKMDDEQRKALRKRAAWVLDHIEEL